MTPITRILVPVDLSARSLGAADYAGSLAAKLGSELVFVHALQNGWPLGPAQRGVRDGIGRNSYVHRFLFREGSPVSVILGTAGTEKCDLILMPTRGRPALARLLDGSTTAQVLREASCPVWVGLDNLLPLTARPIRTILCGLSLGPRGNAVLRWSANLAMQLDATLSLVHQTRRWNRIPAFRAIRNGGSGSGRSLETTSGRFRPE
jgi:nucleotide-binding universal stress UspA family protein